LCAYVAKWNLPRVCEGPREVGGGKEEVSKR
jgi:hypothetical protein